MECTSKKYFVPFEQVQTLRATGKFQMGVDNHAVLKMRAYGVFDDVEGLKSVDSAGTIWMIIGYVVLLAGIVASFMYQWWIFIPAIILHTMLHNANKKSVIQGILDIVLSNKSFYERLAMTDAILYHFDNQTEADKFLRNAESAR